MVIVLLWGIGSLTHRASVRHADDLSRPLLQLCNKAAQSLVSLPHSAGIAQRSMASMTAMTPDGDTTDQRSDEELARLVRGGDDRAFETLYRRHCRTAQSVARSMLHSEHDAEDAVADAFTSLYAALARDGGPHESFRPYLMACVRNSCRHRLRKQ